MNKLLCITTVVDRPVLLENTVEKLAQRHTDFSYSEKFKTTYWQSFDSSSVETYLEGSNAFREENSACRSSFTAPFLFTCLQQKDKEYKLTWSVSLS